MRVLLARKANAAAGGLLWTIRSRQPRRSEYWAIRKAAAAVRLLLPAGERCRAGRMELRQEAVRALARSRMAARQLVKLAEQKKLDPALTPVAGFALHAANFGNLEDAGRTAVSAAAGQELQAAAAAGRAARSAGRRPPRQARVRNHGHLLQVPRRQRPGERSRAEPVGNRQQAQPRGDVRIDPLSQRRHQPQLRDAIRW